MRKVTVRGHISLDYKVFRPTNIKPVQLFPPSDMPDLKYNPKLA